MEVFEPLPFFNQTGCCIHLGDSVRVLQRFAVDCQPLRGRVWTTGMHFMLSLPGLWCHIAAEPTAGLRSVCNVGLH